MMAAMAMMITMITVTMKVIMGITPTIITLSRVGSPDHLPLDCYHDITM